MVFVNKKKGLKFPPQLTVEVFLDSLLSKFSSVVNWLQLTAEGHFRLLHVFLSQTKYININLLQFSLVKRLKFIYRVTF